MFIGKAILLNRGSLREGGSGEVDETGGVGAEGEEAAEAGVGDNKGSGVFVGMEADAVGCLEFFVEQEDD